MKLIEFTYSYTPHRSTDVETRTAKFFHNGSHCPSCGGIETYEEDCNAPAIYCLQCDISYEPPDVVCISDRHISFQMMFQALKQKVREDANPL